MRRVNFRKHYFMEDKWELTRDTFSTFLELSQSHLSSAVFVPLRLSKHPDSQHKQNIKRWVLLKENWANVGPNL